MSSPEKYTKHADRVLNTVKIYLKMYHCLDLDNKTNTVFYNFIRAGFSFKDYTLKCAAKFIITSYQFAKTNNIKITGNYLNQSYREFKLTKTKNEE
jgi:hypothetical protein